MELKISLTSSDRAANDTPSFVQALLRDLLEIAHMNMSAEKTLMDLIPQEAFKVEMLLKEAELFEHDLQFISFTHAPGPVAGMLSRWIEGEDNLHTGSLTLFIKSSHDERAFIAHPKRKLKLIADSIRVKEIHEAILIGRDIAVINVEGHVGIYRDKRFVDSLNKIIKSVIRISLIEQQREQV